MAQLDSGRGADIDRTLVEFLHVAAADDMRHDGKDNLIFGMILGGLPEQVFQDRNLGQARNAAQRLCLLVFHDSAQQVGFAVFEADFVFDLALPDDGLADAANVLLACDRGNIHQNLESDFAIGMNVRSDVDVHADVEILELRVDQRVDADAADARLERSSGDGNPVTNFQRSFLSIESANLRILNQLGVAVAHHRRQDWRKES